jgi:hypothetical protein
MNSNYQQTNQENLDAAMVMLENIKKNYYVIGIKSTENVRKPANTPTPAPRRKFGILNGSKIAVTYPNTAPITVPVIRCKTIPRAVAVYP